MPDLADRVAIVTGGSRGIGRAIVHRLREEGARVASFDVIPPDPGEPFDAPDLHVDCDVTDGAAVAAATVRVAEQLGAPATILVNNAGVNAYADAATMGDEEWDAFFALDLKACWLTARAALPQMRAAGRGAIVNVSSIHATLTQRGRFPYAAAKAGIVGLTRSLALDEGPNGIRANAVCPGLIDTQLAREGFARDGGHVTVEQLASDQPVGRVGRPLDVAHTVAFLASDEKAGFVNGASIAVDGGVGARLS
ncbi:SDR family oxidoreductase [Conexibacter sp. JD483]|uniref:SDR family NAD(P)-dependent oxidoreductase n=1 Tax=unclassified Conexibacter TaxID=2627773 RepID=UPI00271D5B0F|nr:MULTISPECIES: SDR family oxidoreductase [unclassified Conexibacter]MDO8189259.1 SDR family oxidoreductase [Conexibacter sp. CPCC 205706]MDO8201266.1 SDR family oxidoreductase [Conexibacter sp. CPCC 205762]MDR9372179.1 SDR family oxidoreductase [Conexibacter sp. JD483]